MRAGGAARSARPGDDVSFGIALTFGYAALVPVSETAAKLLGDTTVAPEISLVRFIIHAAVLGGFIALAVPRSDWRPRPLWPIVLRGLCATFGTFFVYAGLAVMPLVDAVAIFFAQPLLLTALSAVFLRESVGWARWLAVVAGMTGAMLIIGPNFERVGWGAMLPAAAALFHAFSALLTRRFASAARLPVFQFITATIAICVATVVLAAGSAAGITAITPHIPSANELGLMSIVGLASMATNLMLTQAFRIAPTSIIAPFLYLHIVGSTVAGYLIFAHVPGTQTVAGTVLIVGAGLFVWWRESRADRAGG